MKRPITSVRVVRAHCLLILFAFLPSLLAAQAGISVDRGELESSLEADIDFLNYVGPVERIDSREAIRGIGRAIGSAVREVGEGGDGRYRAERVIGDPTEPRLAADIIELGAGARVDHIDNLRRIVAGYLEEAWDYSADDADLLARFTTIYNAVHRGNMTFFTSRYRTAVIAALDAARVGLATSYQEWAGQTQLVIPIRDERAPGALDAVDPRQLIGPEVISELRNRTDLGIEDRKAIISFIERVIEERTEAIAEEREELAAEQEAIDERQAELAEADAATAPEPAVDEPANDSQEAPRPVDQPAEQGDTLADEPDSVADDDPGTAGAEEDRRSGQAPVDDADAQPVEPQDEAPTDTTATEQSVTEEEALVEREEEIAARQEELDEEEAEVEELTRQVEELYQETAEDQSALEDGSPAQQNVPFVRVSRDGGLELTIVDLNQGEVVGEQTIPIAQRALVPYQGGFLVAHRETGQLLLVDAGTLGIIAESDHSVIPEGRLIAVGPRILAPIPVDGQVYVGEFDAGLVLQRRSAEPVLPQTDIAVRGERILIQSQNRQLRVLQLSDLE
jgi:hypothetical protein